MIRWCNFKLIFETFSRNINRHFLFPPLSLSPSFSQTLTMISLNTSGCRSSNGFLLKSRLFNFVSIWKIFGERSSRELSAKFSVFKSYKAERERKTNKAKVCLHDWNIDSQLDTWRSHWELDPFCSLLNWALLNFVVLWNYLRLSMWYYFWISLVWK